MSKGARQLLPLLVALAQSLGLALLYLGHSPKKMVVWLFGLALGFALERSRFCFAAGFRDPFITRSTSLARGIIAGLLVATAGFAVYHLIYPASRIGVEPAGPATAVGGLLFGTGMVLAGGCASGTMMRVGEGMLLQWISFLALVAGTVLGAYHYQWWWNHFISGSPRIYWPDLLGFGPAVLFQLLFLGGLYLFLLRQERRHFPAPLRRPARPRSPYERFFREAWPYWAGAVVLGLLNTLLLFYSGRPWGITTSLSLWGYWFLKFCGLSPGNWPYYQQPALVSRLAEGFWEWGTILNLGTIGGAFLSVTLAGQFRLRRPRSWRQVGLALLGGLAMGYGSRLAYGCNIGAFFSAVPALSLHGWVFGLFLLGGAGLGSWLLLRLLLEE
ncbi:MAG: YeeE/YedE family protein [Firmicutes bacterium]|nr:YeeE/YedE family protein [Bacillota bacterium]